MNMSQYKRPTSQKAFEENFKQKKPLMNDTEAAIESARCLFCYDAPCIKACPTHIDIPLFIKQIQTKNKIGAAKSIYEANWLGNACGIVCPTGVLCEGACVYNHQDMPPIQIGRLQNYATYDVIHAKQGIFNSGAPNGKKVAIIGAGPAGIACACELRTFGYSVDIFEAKGKPSGLMMHGIAPYKITNEEVLYEIGYLQHHLGFHIKYYTPISSKEQILSLEIAYDAIFLGVGLGKTANLGIEGEELEGVIGAVEFIEELRIKQHLLEMPERVVVIGGGNTAMDAASEAARMGVKKVILAYRRSMEEMGAYKFEYDLAMRSGVQSYFNVAPISIVGDEKVSGIQLAKTKKVNGTLHLDVENTFIEPCDMVIKATGQVKMGAFYEMIKNLSLDTKGRIIVDDEKYQTSNPKYFAGGDAINGGAEVVNAAYHGKMAAQGIHTYLFNKK